MAGANVSQDCVHVDSNLNDSRTFFVSKLTNALQKKINPAKAPTNFAKSLEEVCQTQGPSLSKNLLRAGTIVYVAYFLAGESLKGLDRLSTEDLKFVTAKVASAPRDVSIDTFITKFFETNQRSKKFRFMVDSINREYTMSLEPAPTESTASTEAAYDQQRFVMNTEATRDQEHPMASDETMHNRDHVTANNHHYGGRYFASLYKTIGFDMDTSQQIPWPSATSLSNVFPVYLTRVIVKAPNGNAWFRISYSDPAQSVLEMFVCAPETQHITKELFDLNITTQKEVRGVLLDNNVFLEIKGSLKLSGSPIDKVVKLLGTLAAEAYQRSSTRTAEVAQGMLTITYCLSMEIWPEADCPSLLTLKADVATLSTIASHLWPSPY